ncbi:MAG TPA: hypothetical protein VEG65_02870 [Candidatus Bathyarchaeia archaeon]|nr:hypothetical protein [Candidatus Bathyarchaeia archaeon]
MREAETKSAGYVGYAQDESIFGLSGLASLPALLYLLFFLFVLVIYSANPFEPAVFGFYKLSIFFQITSFFAIFFVPALLIYFALDLTKSVGHTVIVLGYPILALGAAAILNTPDAQLFAAVTGLLPFAFYFLIGFNRSAIARQTRAPRATYGVRQGATVPSQLPPQGRPLEPRTPAQRRLMSRYAPNRPSDFRREARPQYGSPDGFLARLDRFLDRYDYVDGEAVPKGTQRSARYERDRYERDRRRGGR